METFVWTPEFATGIPLLDRQHRGLVDLINELGDHLMQGAAADDGPHLDALFDRLEAYARHHFTDEEHLMAAGGLDPDDLERHRELHDRFIEQVALLWRARATMAHPAEVLGGFLTAWLAFHILGEDHLIARQLIDKGTLDAGLGARRQDTPAPGEQEATTRVLLSALKNLYHVLSEQNRDLAAANARLEARVEARTRELADANDALRRMALTDGLLGIANRMHFNERLALECGRARRSEEPLSLVMIDVDHFKRFNDRHGHLAGDACLQGVARACEGAIRRATDLVARYGGEELAVVLPNTDNDGALQVANAIRTAVEGLALSHGASPTSAFVTVSVGVATRDGPTVDTPEALVALADAALYAAKSRGRNCVATS